MKKNILITIICFSCFCLLVQTYIVNADSQIDIRNLDTNIFIGQVYPSGNVYLKRFREVGEDAPPFPKELSLMPVGNSKPVLNSKMKGSFVKVMKDVVTEDHEVKVLHIPGAEGMGSEDDHRSCGLGEMKKVEQYEYISGEFFYSIFDYCDSNEGVGLYHTDPSKYSFMVLGFGPGIEVTDIKPLSGRRPLTPADREVMIKLKRENRKEAAQYGCPTVPAYIDKATQIAEIGLAQRDLRLRLSTFDNPHCSGDLTSVYVLDVLRGSEVLGKFEFNQPRGSL